MSDQEHPTQLGDDEALGLALLLLAYLAAILGAAWAVAYLFDVIRCALM